MQISPPSTTEPMHLILNMLRNIEGKRSRDEQTLRQLRHCLGVHLQLPGMPDPVLPRLAAGAVTDKDILSFLQETLRAVRGAYDDDQLALDQVEKVIAAQLSA
jgi:hypothetical protein